MLLALEDVEEAIQVNRRLQVMLKQRYRRVCEMLSYISAFRTVFCEPIQVTNAYRRLARKRDRAYISSGMLYLQTYMESCQMYGPFRDAGIYAEDGCVRYAPIPLTTDEVLRREANVEFPSLQWNKTTIVSWSKEEDDALIAAVNSYNGIRCGSSFWLALTLPGKSRFDIASRYVLLCQKKNIKFVTKCELISPLTKKEKEKAAKDAVYHHVGDLGEIFAAYVEFLSAAARRRSYMTEVIGNVPVFFPPYVWERRGDFRRSIGCLIREVNRRVVRCESPQSDDVPLSQCYCQVEPMRPSLVDLTACLLALKGNLFGEKSSFSEVVRVFLSSYETGELTLPELLALRL